MSDDWLGKLGEKCEWTVEDFGRVLRSACRGLAPTDADDVRQEVAKALGIAFRRGIPPGLVTVDDVDKYVCTAARHARWKFLRKRAAESKRLTYASPADLNAGGSKPEYETRPQLSDELLRGLTEGQRERILSLVPDDERQLRDFLRLRLRGMSGREIARQLGKSEPTVSRRLAECENYLDAENLARLCETNPDGGGQA